MSDLIASAAAQTTFDGRKISTPSDPAARTRFEFLLPVASTIKSADLQKYIHQLNREHLKYFGPEPGAPDELAWRGGEASAVRLTLVPDAREALHHARASVVASGTATVLAAIVGNPFVVVYRVSALTFALAKRLVRYPDEFPDMTDDSGNLPVAMPNLIAGRRIVPELLQSRFTAQNVASELAPLLADTPERQAQVTALADLRNQLLAPGDVEAAPLERAADVVLELLSGASPVTPPASA